MTDDRIITDGFPQGWLVQDRLDEKVALLIQESPGMWPGSSCICVRPKALKTDEWLPTARQIAHSLARDASLANALTMTGCQDEGDLIDMAKVGQSLMNAIETYIKAPSLIEGWSPADDPAEIVGDLYNSFEESIACHKADLERLKAVEAALAGQKSKAIDDVIAERRRQVEVEGFDASHDDMATKGQLATAAACYAFQAGARGRQFPDDPEPIAIWPWDREWWKPVNDNRRNLVKAAALIIAEIERLDRAAAKSEGR